jgi:kynurenine formamidase
MTLFFPLYSSYRFGVKGVGLMNRIGIAAIIFIAACTTAPAPVDEHAATVEESKTLVPTPPWSEGDEQGMANTQSRGTRLRCAFHLAHPLSKAYELSHVRSESAPVSPFGVPLDYTFRPTSGLPGTKHAFNGESVSGEPAAQGTQMDALGHFAYLSDAWDGSGSLPEDQLKYYGGFTQSDVKPTPDSPLLKLGVEHVPPIVTSAVLLDARKFLGDGEPLEAGRLITAADIEAMIEAQGLAWRGLLPGDVLYIYTGWEDYWEEPDEQKVYYTKGPGLSYDAVQYIGDKAVVLVALDNPFTDPVSDGQLTGHAPPPEGTPEGLPFVIHHHNLTQSGIHQIQNAHLEELAADEVWTSCTIILPLRVRGGSGSPVRPVAFGAPRQQE